MIVRPVTVVLVAAATVGRHAEEMVRRPGVTLLATAAPAEAVRVVTERQPQVVVVDLDAAPDALSAVESVSAAVPSARVLTLSAAPDHAVVLAAVRAGATSHLVTAAGTAADALARTACGEAVFSPGLAEVVLERFGRPLDPQEGARRLTEREADVLRLVVEGLTARQIAGRLVLSPRTVENHVQNMLRKLQVSGRAALVRYAIEHGLA
ncbi:response regulator transcription factor [Pseudonocardia nigra]|uniref:response regulator transcription factor n=1 Tax=Pseudonocardia nigra TaxID=1921578 RepID=UPI001C600D5F|nr:response regulator transcription factor [Pseudonocardia nigra]